MTENILNEVKMTNYIIKNCPANPSDIKACYGWCQKEQKKCQDCIHCVIKKIVAGCQQHLYGGKILMANDILEWLDIEEVKE